MSKETDEEYAKRQLQRRARRLQRESGMKYTEALRAVKEAVEQEESE